MKDASFRYDPARWCRELVARLVFGLCVPTVDSDKVYDPSGASTRPSPDGGDRLVRLLAPCNGSGQGIVAKCTYTVKPNYVPPHSKLLWKLHLFLKPCLKSEPDSCPGVRDQDSAF